MNNTIAAISTPIGQSAIGVVRITGKDSIKICDLLFCGKKKLSKVHTHTAHYGTIVDPETGEILDQVVATVYRSPHSYTGENMVEISCHGNPVILNQLLQLLFRNGLELAPPGEFTRRAYLNGKIDLNQAEAVNDLVQAHTRYARASALSHLEGKFSAVIEEIHSDTLDLLSVLEAAIDHSDLDLEFESYTHLKQRVSQLSERIDYLLSTAKPGRMIRSGLRIAIIGAPNTGKSSLMNYLLREDRVIVSDIPGTTRDTVEHELNIQGIPVRLFDTAGVRETKDHLERMGIERTRQAIERADLLMFLFDGSRETNNDDWELFDIIKGRNNIYLLNKCDLPLKLNFKAIKNQLNIELIPISAKTGEGIEQVEQAVFDYYWSFGINPLNEVMVVNTRQEQLLKKVRNYLIEANRDIDRGMSEEFVAADVRKARLALEEILGRTPDDKVLERIFSRFCVGK